MGPYPYGVLPNAGNWWCLRLGWGHSNKPNSTMFWASYKFNHHPNTHNSQLPIECPGKSILLHVCLLICRVLGFLDSRFAFNIFFIFLLFLSHNNACLSAHLCQSFFWRGSEETQHSHNPNKFTECCRSILIRRCHRPPPPSPSLHQRSHLVAPCDHPRHIPLSVWGGNQVIYFNPWDR